MNSDELSLVSMIIGPRGSCKTLLCTHFEIEALSKAWAVKKLREASGNDNLYPKKKVNIWSSYPVEALWRPPHLSRPVKLTSQPLDMERLLTWKEEYRHGIIFFDEIDQVADRQDWMSVAAKLLVAGIKLMRHRNISLIGTLQEIDELNARLYKQSDVIIKCRNLAFTPWGRENRLNPGDVAQTTWIDKSGILTGYSFAESNESYPLKFFGKRYFGDYSTEHEVDILEYKRKWKLNLEAHEITDKLAKDDNVQDIVRATVEYYIYNQPGGKIKTVEFWETARRMGFTGDARNWGKYLKNELGVHHTGAGDWSYYHFDKMKDLEGVV